MKLLIKHVNGLLQLPYYPRFACDLAFSGPQFERSLMDSKNISLYHKAFVYQQNFFARHWFNQNKQGYSPVCFHNPKSNKKETCLDNSCGLSCPNFKAVPLTLEIIRRHLSGKETIGTYQLKDQAIKWLCFDLDDSGIYTRPLAGEVRRVEEQMGLISAVLESKNLPFIVEESSPHCYHIWLFFDQPILAKEGRAFGKHLLETVNLPLKGKDHPDGVELFPKQEEAKKAGNLVKLPLGYNGYKKCWSRFVDRNTLQPVADGTEEQLVWLSGEVE